MYHREQVVTPVRQAARAAVAQSHCGLAGQPAANFGNSVIGHIPDHHGVGGITQFPVPHHHAKAPDDAKFQQAGDAAKHRFFAAAETGGEYRVRLWRQCDAAFQRIGQCVVGAFQRWRRAGFLRSP